MARKLKLNLKQMLKKQFDPSKSKALENLASILSINSTIKTESTPWSKIGWLI